MTTYRYKQLFTIIFGVFLFTFAVYDEVKTKHTTGEDVKYESITDEFANTEAETNISNPYAISESGRNFIKSTESLSLTSYWDVTGYAVGYGHHGKDICDGITIDSLQAEKYFDEDLQRVEKSVKRLIEKLPYKYKFSQGFVDGLSSLVYNCGEAGVRNTEFYKRLKQCRVVDGVMNKSDLNYTLSVVKETKISCSGHVKRRQKEYAMMID